MPDFRHEFGWTGYCRYCGVSQTAIEDNIASPNCDIVRHRANWRAAIPVSIGIIITIILMAGFFHGTA